MGFNSTFKELKEASKK